MLVDVHLRKEDGTPGKLFDTIDREPSRNHRNAIWITFDGEDWPVLTGVRPFIVIPEHRLTGIREVKKAGRPRK
jgi:hypothetical protein